MQSHDAGGRGEWLPPPGAPSPVAQPLLDRLGPAPPPETRFAVPEPPEPPCAFPGPRGEAGPAGRLTQPGAGGEVSLPPAIEPRVVPVVVVSTPTTRMSPAGIPFAFTVTEPVAEPPMPTVV